jgi:cyclic-di-GMP-binding protein
LSYSPAPTGIWREIHALYRYAENLNLVSVAIDEPLNNAQGKSTVLEAYKHALLLDLGDPYHLPSRMIAKIDQYLEAVAGLATLQPATNKPEDDKCQFVIDTENDQAGLIHSEDDMVDSSGRYRLLNTLELARTIHTQLTQLQSGEVPDMPGLPPDFFKRSGQDMLLRLIHVWGINPKRAFRRSERPNAKVEVVIGLAAIDYCSRRLAPSGETAPGPTPANERLSIGTFGAQQARMDAAAYQFTLWDIQDESAGGMALSKVGTARGRVRVGDLVATRFTGDAQWTISSVRWVKSANPSSVEIGIQRIAPTAKPAVIKAVSGDQEESDFLPALLLPAIPALKEPESLVIPTNMFRPDRMLYLDDGLAPRRIVVKQLLEAATGYERVGYEPA